MIPTTKLEALIKGLTDKSAKNLVTWQTAKFVNERVRGFKVVLGDSALVVGFFSPPQDPDRYFVQLTSGDAKVAELEAIEEQTFDWNLIKALFDEAVRVTTKWDVILERFQSKLSDDGPIGDPLPPSDDIPF